MHLLSQRPGWTGSGVSLDAIVRGADRQGGAQMVVVGTPAGDPLPAVAGMPSHLVRPLTFESDSLPFPLPGMSDVMPYTSSRFSRLTGEQLAKYRIAWKRHLASVIDEFRPDVIHSHHLWLMSALVKDVAPEVPVVTHCHGTGLRQMGLCPHLADEVRDGCVRNDAFLVLHRGHAEVLERELGIAADKIHIIGSGFREDLFHATGRATCCGPALAYAGKLSDAKGVPWLLDAMEVLGRRVPGLRLHVAGSGSGAEADTIRQRMAGMDTVIFHGQLGQSALADLMRRAAVFVLPSFYEGLPLVLVEAAACGCRIVATALPGVLEQLQPQLGDSLELVSLPRLVNQDCPVADDLPTFVDGLVRALETSLRRPPTEDAGNLVRDMTWSAVFQRIEACWRRVATSAE